MDVWHDEMVDTVHRETEDAAFKSIREQVKMFSKARMITLTPNHRRIALREKELMHRYSHYNEAQSVEVIAREFGYTPQYVKKILFQVSIIYHLLTETGMEALLDAA